MSMGFRLFDALLLQRWGRLIASSAAMALAVFPAFGDEGGADNGQLRFVRENLNLPDQERMGWVGGGLLFKANDVVSAGVESYGAVTGERGGFITLGGSVLARLPLSSEWAGEAGLHIGAGGGRGGYFLTGGGLLLRAHLGVDYRLSAADRIGFGVSDVRFPDGAIQSRQPFVSYQHDFSMLRPGGWGLALSDQKTASPPVPTRAHSISAVVRHYKIPAGVTTDAGLPQYPKMQLVGIAWERFVDSHWFLSLESDGAAGGKSTGFMQILVGGGVRWPMFGRVSARLSVSAGPAGGGGADTGGGTITDIGAGVDLELARNTRVGIHWSAVHSWTESFRATSTSFRLTRAFDLPDLGDLDAAYDWSGFAAERVRVRATVQRYRQGAPNWRSDHVEQPVDNLGFQLDYFPRDAIYLTGQGLAAYAGDAGAYMTGLLGAGMHQPVLGRGFVELEALAGAAGGGGLQTGGGAVLQGMVNAGWHLSNATSVAFSAGRLQAINGPFRANVFGVTMAHRFSLVLR